MAHPNDLHPAALGLAAQAWCGPSTRHQKMDEELAFEFARVLLKHFSPEVLQAVFSGSPVPRQDLDLSGASAKGYVAGGIEFLYPGAGDPEPPGGAKVQLLTVGGICVEGRWPTTGAIGWAPLPKRNKQKEQGL